MSERFLLARFLVAVLLSVCVCTAVLTPKHPAAVVKEYPIAKGGWHDDFRQEHMPENLFASRLRIHQGTFMMYGSEHGKRTGPSPIQVAFVTNVSSHPLYYAAYNGGVTNESPGSLFDYTEELRGGVWGVGGECSCGDGLDEYELKPGQTVTFRSHQWKGSRLRQRQWTEFWDISSTKQVSSLTMVFDTGIKR